MDIFKIKRFKLRGVLFGLILVFSCSISKAQLVQNFGVYDTTYNASKMRFIGITTGTAYTGSMILLSQLWYTKRVPFHFFNDNRQWNQMDKIGHSITAFHEGNTSIELLKWSGVKKKGWMIVAGMSGFALQLPIEILDGYSPDYGASNGDIIANFTGSALVTGEYLLWGQNYTTMKFSFSPSPLAKAQIRPNILGSTWNEQVLKDYNGQTYWLSTNLYPFLKQNSKFPKWITLDLGYGAENMLHGNPEENLANGYQSYRQYYIAPGIDFTRIPTNKRGLKILFFVMNIFHPPVPALEFSKHGIKGHALHF